MRRFTSLATILFLCLILISVGCGGSNSQNAGHDDYLNNGSDINSPKAITYKISGDSVFVVTSGSIPSGWDIENGNTIDFDISFLDNGLSSDREEKWNTKVELSYKISSGTFLREGTTTGGLVVYDDYYDEGYSSTIIDIFLFMFSFEENGFDIHLNFQLVNNGDAYSYIDDSFDQIISQPVFNDKYIYPPYGFYNEINIIFDKIKIGDFDSSGQTKGGINSFTSNK